MFSAVLPFRSRKSCAADLELVQSYEVCLERVGIINSPAPVDLSILAAVKICTRLIV